MGFKFDLGAEVFIILTDTEAEVIGRAEYINGSPNSYWLYYEDNQGDARKVWFDEQELGLVKSIDD